MFNNDTIKEFVGSSNRVDSSSKALFVEAFKLMKDNTPQKVKINFDKEITRMSLGNENIIKRGKKVIKLAERYKEHKALTKFSMLHFYNLELTVKVLEFMQENHPLSVDSVRKRVAGVYSKDLNKVEYNNKIAEVLKDIKQEYGLVEQEGGIVALDSKLKNTLMHLSDEDKRAVIEMLGGVVVAQEVA